MLTLLYQHLRDSPEEHNLGSYEILSSEGLHDTTDHIKNVFEELPYHLEGAGKAAFNSFYAAEIGSRAMVRGSDFRRAALALPAVLGGKVSSSVQGLVNTLAELSSLLYIMEEERTPRAILRLYNVSFQHAQYCVEVLHPPKKLSSGVLFGLYHHKLSTHAAGDTRIISGYSRLTESDERQFKELRKLSHNTTGHPQDVARQLFEWMQLKHALTTADVSSFTEEHQDLAKKAKYLPCTDLDSIFDKTFMKKNQLSFQAHLERIADYLVLGPGIWWEDIGDQIRFFDGGVSPVSDPKDPLLAIFDTPV